MNAENAIPGAETRRTLRIREFIPAVFDREVISDEQGETLHASFGRYLDVEFPSPRSNRQWRLMSKGWVGTIPLSPELHIVLEPKVSIGNLFRMLEYAYDLKSFHVLEGEIESASLQDIYDRLATMLAKGVLQRSRRGLYRTYVGDDDRLPYVRGAIDMQEAMRRPWHPSIHCHFQEHTADVEENQILGWTLYTIARGGSLSRRAIGPVRAAYRALHTGTSLQHFSPRDCVGRLYNRLNDDYEPLHALCRFFLEHTGPTHEEGDRRMFPFLVNMGRLYELFVARWLKKHLDPEYRLVAQEGLSLNAENQLTINIDLVIYERGREHPTWVLDTKYKAPDAPSHNDLNQIVAYAAAKRAPRAVLIYPAALPQPFNARYGGSDIIVQTLKFGLEHELDIEGQAFVGTLLNQQRHSG